MTNARKLAFVGAAGAIAAVAVFMGMRAVCRQAGGAAGEPHGVKYAKGSFAERAANRYSHLPPEERRLAIAIQDSCDAENLSDLRGYAKEARGVDNQEVRLAAVEALVWFEAKAIDDLLAWFDDPDAEVATAARDGFDTALSMIESPARRLQYAERVLSTKLDADFRESLMTQFVGAANELVDDGENERRAARYRREVVRMLAAMIDNPDAAVSGCGKDMYREITGAPWAGLEDAKKYIADPDAYSESATEK